jgi:hypothetical protein
MFNKENFMAIEFVRNIITSGYNLSLINENFDKIQTALQDGLSRSGATPNQMLADIDLNGNDLLNVNVIDADNYLFNGQDLLSSTILQQVANALPEINAVAEITTEVNLVGDNISAILSAVGNLDEINNFSDVYAGARDTAPTLRNDGSALQDGDLYYNTTDNKLYFYSGGDWTSVQDQNINMAVKSFTGDGSTTVWTLDVAPGVAKNMLVWVGGVRQAPVTDYTISGTSLTISPAVASGVSIDTLVVANITSLGVVQVEDGSVDLASIDPTAYDGIADALDTVRTVSQTLTSGEKTQVQQNLDLEPGVDIQAYDAQLAAMAALSPVAGSFIRWAGATTPVVQAIEGTVSKSGSTVTGAIYETGSNANGNYIKFGNGIMICWNEISATADAWSTALGSFFTPAASYTWTYPVAFSTTSGLSVLAQVRRSAATVVGTDVQVPGTTTCTIMPWSATSIAATSSKVLTVFAIGIWS